MSETIQCPKCGFEQEDSVECLRCGIIFSRIHRPAEAAISENATDPDEDSNNPPVGRFRRFCRIFRWVSLPVIIVVAGLILYDSPPPEVEITSHATEQAEVKFQEFKSDLQRGRPSELELDQSELNGWLETNLAMRDPVDADSSNFRQRESGTDTIDTVLQQYEIDEEELEKAKSSIRDLQVELLEDTLRLYALFDAYGLDLSLEIEGRLRVQDGYLRLEPVGGRLGSLPLPAGTLRSAVEKIFESPENREKFRLPPNIRDIQIDRGQLVVTSI